MFFIRKKISILFWRILRKSRVFRYWYKKFLNELMFDLELYDLEKESITVKYQDKLNRANSVWDRRSLYGSS